MNWKTVILSVTVMFMACTTTQNISLQEEGRKVKATPISTQDVEQPLFFGDVPNDPDVLTGKLPNGLTYYIKKNSKPESRAELRLVVKAGSIEEDADQLGIAHFVEHMAFNGTENFEKNELVDYLESVGSQFGPDLNAYTSFDETVYMLQVRTDDEEQLEKGLLVLSDWAGGLTFDPEEIDKERGVVISEWRSRLSPNQRMSNEYLPVLLKGSRYANRLPIGDPEIIENADVQTIKKFYYNWYRPDLMAVVLVGDFNPTLMEDYVNSYFSKLPKSINPRKKKKYDIPEHDSTLIKICSDPEAAFTQVQIVNKMPSKKMWSIGDYIHRMEATLISDMIASRLQELTRAKDATLMYAFANQGLLFGPADAFTVFAVTPEGGADKGFAAAYTELLRARKFGFTEGELARAKEKMKKEAEVRLNEMDKTDSKDHAGKLINHFLTERPYPSAKDYHWMINKYVDGIKLEDLMATLESWTSSSNRVVIVTSPEKEGLQLPSESDLRKLIRRLEKQEIEPYNDEVVEGPLVQYPEVEVSIQEKREIKENGIEVWTLGNGGKVVFKATDFSNDEILFQAFSEGGLSIFDDEDYNEARTCTQLIQESGLGRFSASDLKKKLAAKNVRLYNYESDYSHHMRGSCSKVDVQTLADLVYMKFEKLRKDAETFETFKSRMKSFYTNLESDPQYYFGNRCAQEISNNHPRKKMLTVEDIDALDMENMFQAYQRMFGDPSNFTFVFVGNVDDNLKEEIANRIGQLAGTGVKLAKQDRGISMQTNNSISWEKGTAPKTYVRIVLSETHDYSDEEKLRMSALRDALNIRLREALREDKGGVYGVGVRLNIYDFPKGQAILNISFNSDPEREEELIEETERVLASFFEEGPSDDEMQKVLETKRQQYVKGFKENGFWLNQIVKTLQDEKQLSSITLEQKEAGLSQLTKENIQSVGERFCSGTGKLILVQRPE